MECHFSKVIDIIQSLWSNSSSAMDGWLKAKICNMAGCCYSLMGKHHISKDWFAQAINEDTGYMLALRNLSSQFRLLEKYDREMEMLQLLVKVATDLERQSGVKSDNVSYVGVLYLLSKRHFDLNQYEEAAKWFECLLKLFDEKFVYQFGQSCDISTVPELQIIYHHTAYSYLNIKKYDSCIDICQKAIDSYCRGNNVSTSLQQFKEEGKDATSSEQAKNLKFCVDGKEASILLQHLSSDVIALLMRSAAFYHSGRKDEALFDMKRARSILMLKNSTVLVPSDSSSNQTRKRKHEDDTESIDTEEVSKEKTILDYLMSQVLNNLAVLCIEQKHHQEAIHLLRISLSCLPGNIDAAYNSAILMARLGHKNHAIETWKNFKVERRVYDSYLSSISSEQIQKLEQVINSVRPEENTQFKLVISDKWPFSIYSYNVELGSSSALRQIYMPLYVNLPLLA